MSKITFRADDDLIRQLEEFDASKSEVMREALREYLRDNSNSRVNASESDVNADSSNAVAGESLDDIIVERVDAIITERLDGMYTPSDPQDVNVNISLDGDSGAEPNEMTVDRKTSAREPKNRSDDADHTCKQCGENLPQSAVYCSNCGEKASHRVFCECGDELRSDWGFCPGCGRRTPAADVLNDP